MSTQLSSGTSINMPYLPTSRQFDSDQEQLQVTLTKMYNEMSTAVNARTIGIFNTVQVVTGDRYYPIINNDIHTPVNQRQSYRKLFILPATAAGATTTIPHGITGITEGAAWYGNATTAVPDFRPIPYADAALVTNQISLTITATNIIVVNGSTAPNITGGNIILEFLLN